MTTDAQWTWWLEALAGKRGELTKGDPKSGFYRARKRACALRDGFADVLGGLYLKEEIEDAIPTRQSNQPPVPPAPTVML